MRVLLASVIALGAITTGCMAESSATDVENSVRSVLERAEKSGGQNFGTSSVNDTERGPLQDMAATGSRDPVLSAVGTAAMGSRSNETPAQTNEVPSETETPASPATGANDDQPNDDPKTLKGEASKAADKDLDAPKSATQDGGQEGTPSDGKAPATAGKDERSAPVDSGGAPRTITFRQGGRVPANNTPPPESFFTAFETPARQLQANAATPGFEAARAAAPTSFQSVDKAPTKNSKAVAVSDKGFGSVVRAEKRAPALADPLLMTP